MRISLITFIAGLLITLFCDGWIYRRLLTAATPGRKPRSRGSRRAKGHTSAARGPAPWGATLQLWSAIALYLMLGVAVGLLWLGKADSRLGPVMWMTFTFVSVYAGKVAFTICDLMASLPRLWHGRRWQWLTGTGLCLGVLAVAAMWWGALWQRYRLQIRQVTVEVPGLPAAFDGLKLAQISDFHLGTYVDDPAFPMQVIDAIDSQGVDAVLFTGDIVNCRSEEILPFTSVLRHLKAPMGVYAILGNHDYGDYGHWDADSLKEQNRQILYQAFDSIGWRLLRNQTAWLVRGSDSLALVGVENIGEPPFHSYGDLKASYPGALSDTMPKILLTHNPRHWLDQVCDNPRLNVPLTLSGHTHAMQIELLGLSPAALRYPTWGGLYRDTDGSHQLYVNIGLGTVGLPMRLGATPEITILTLRPKKQSPAAAPPSTRNDSGK